MAALNRQVTLAARPVGFPKISDFSLSYVAVPTPAAGEVLVRSIYLSLEPYIRLRMNAADAAAEGVALGDVMVGRAVAIVVQSENPAFRAGDAVEGMLGWQEHAVVRGSELRKLDLRVGSLSAALGVLGMPGLAAYFGLLQVGDSVPGETVVVSGAAGAIGMVVGQIAKIETCRAVGVAASDTNVAWLRDELEFDGVLHFTTATEFDNELAVLCPDGVDVYFDNVGGATTDAVMRRINPGARIVVCGQMSQDNLESPEMGPRWLGELIAKRARVEGFRVDDYAQRFPAGRRKLGGWLRQGRLKYREEIARGLEAAPQAFIGMLQGRNQGKQLVQLYEP